MAADFRGYVQTKAPNLLGFVGNDGGINLPKVQQVLGSNKTGGSALYGYKDVNAVKDAVAKLANEFQNGTAAPAASGGGGSGAASAGGGAATDLSSYDQGIDATNAQINGIDPSTNNAIGTAENNYQTLINQLTQAKAQTDQQYNTGKTTNSQDYVTAKNTINTNTGQTIGGISRLLGSRGAGGQSAGDYAALVAAGQGTQQRAGAGQTFGKNQQSLDQNYGTFINGYNQNVTNAGLQKENDVKSIRASAATNKANLLQSLATLINQRTSAAGGSGVAKSQPYVEQAKALLGEATSLSKPTPVAAQTPLTYTAPSLASYISNPTNVAVGDSGGSAATDTGSTFLSALLNRNKKLQTA